VIDAPTDTPTVLFVCYHNANRSQIAAGYLEHMAGGRIHVTSAGPHPSDHLNPAAVGVMGEVGIDIASATPAALTDDNIAKADVVVTLGCADAVAVQPGKRHQEWTLLDNGDKGLDAARTIRDQIRPRVEALVLGLLT
jgi:arsenate reductase (thioredoxin)